MAEPTSAREALTNRQLPEMVLSDGGLTSKTAPPPHAPKFQSRAEAVLHRFEVKGNAILTGGAGTLALSSARALLEHGLSSLALWDLSASPTAQAEINALQADFADSATISFVAVDITSESAVDDALALTLDFFAQGKAGRRIDILCCFAGVVGCIPSADVDLSEFKRVWGVNGEGTWLCCRAIGRQMISQTIDQSESQPQQSNSSGSSIVLISSISAHRINFPQPQMPYNISKAAISHMARCLAAEWAVHGIRVNAVSPGYQNTILNEGPGLERARSMWTSRNPMGRMGEPSELQGIVVLLCSRAGSYMNGGDFVVDGGGSVF